MINQILAICGGVLTSFWGISHLFPTSGIVKGFGEISEDNKNIITMEWINEGATLIFLGVITILTSLTDYANPITSLIHWCVVGMLIVLSIISLFTGFKVNFIPFKLCPVIFTISALCIGIAQLL